MKLVQNICGPFFFCFFIFCIYPISSLNKVSLNYLKVPLSIVMSYFEKIDLLEMLSFLDEPSLCALKSKKRHAHDLNLLNKGKGSSQKEICLWFCYSPYLKYLFFLLMWSCAHLINNTMSKVWWGVAVGKLDI